MTVMYFDKEGYVKTVIADKIDFLYNSILIKRHNHNSLFIDYKNVINVTSKSNPCKKCSYNPTYGSVVKEADNEKIS